MSTGGLRERARVAAQVYGALFVQMLKVRLAYRGDFFADLVATALGGVASLVFVILLFARIPDLNGWTREEIFLIYGMSMISYGFFGCVSWNLFDFGDRYIIQGRFDRVLVRPAGTYLQVLFDQFRIPALAESAIGLGVLVYALQRVNLELTSTRVLFGLLAILSGTVIFISVFTILASLSFHFEDRIGVSPPVFNMINFGRYPQSIFPSFLRTILKWVVPFGFVAYYPLTAIVGKAPYLGIAAAAPLVALGFALLAAVCWKLGVRRYGSTGS